MEHRAPEGLALLGRQLLWGVAWLEIGEFTSRKQRDSRALGGGAGWLRLFGIMGNIGGWEWGGGVGGWRGDDFTGGGKLEGQVQHCSATAQGLQVEDCWTSLPFFYIYIYISEVCVNNQINK